ncbi:MAG: radical SAM-associated putative lipoprotein [Saprospiraceae bacterium]|nr:radical SAM-associated putative lipoprotein [Saprospiraceae bacterium]
MKAKSTRKKYLRFLNFILATVGILLGFSNSVVAQYGAPINFYRINGNVKSLECEYAIPSIKLLLECEEAKNSNYYKPMETTTDSLGNFTFVVSEYFLRNKLKIIAEDVDGKENGEYFDAQKKVDPNPRTIAENRNWTNYYDIPVDIKMKSRGIPPCEEEQQDTLIIPPEEQFAKIDIPNSIENIVDALSSSDIIVYPNPNKGRFAVRFTVGSSTNVEFRLYDSSGKLILNKKIENVENTVEKNFNIEQMPVGVYFLNIIINGALHTKKIVVN